MIVHVFRRSCRNQMEYWIAGVFGIGFDSGMPVIAKDPPSLSSLRKVAVLQQINRSAAGIFDHPQIIKQNFALIEKSQDKLPVQAVVPHRAPCGDPTV